MGGLNVLRGVVGGIDQATGNTQGAKQMQDAIDRDRQARQSEIRSRIVPHAMAIQGLQQKLSAIDKDKNPNEYNATVDEIQGNLHAMRDILHPDQKLGFSDWLQTHTTDRMHITNHDKRVRDLAAKNAQADARGQAQDAEGAAALAQSSVPWSATPQGQQEKMKGDYAVRVAESRGNNLQPRVIGRTSITDAVKNAQVTGQKYFDPEGNEITLDQMRELPPYAELITVQRGKDTYFVLGDQRAHVTTVGNERYQTPELGGVTGQSTALGTARTPTASTSTTTDPFGVTTTSVRTTAPQTPGMTASAAPGTLQRRPEATPAQSSPAPASGPRTQTLRKLRSGDESVHGQTDENGLIPESANVNPQLREAANNLLKGMDVDKLPIPQKDRAAAEQLARKYGWQGQGMYTPRELKQFHVATAFLKQFQNTPALKVLDSYISREKIARAMDPKGGMVSRLAAKNLTPEESEFVRDYNAALGTIQGLTSITRSGRATEASVNRLKQELPSILQSSGSDDAKKRLDQLFKELDLAVEQDSSVGTQGKQGGAVSDDDILNGLNQLAGAH